MKMSLEMSLWTSYSRDTVFSPPTPCHVLPTQSRGTLRWTQRPRGQLNVIVSKYSPANKEIRLERGSQEEKAESLPGYRREPMGLEETRPGSVAGGQGQGQLFREVMASEREEIKMSR